MGCVLGHRAVGKFVLVSHTCILLTDALLAKVRVRGTVAPR